MDTFNFEKTFYTRRLKELENNTLTKQDIEEIQTMYQIALDKIEYSPNTYKALQEINAYSRLEKLLKQNNTLPLPPFQEIVHTAPSFDNTELSLEDFLNNLNNNIKIPFNDKQLDIFNDVCNFSNWLLKENSNIIFLLRDMFLPYLICKECSNTTATPLLIGRKLIKFFNDSKTENNYDFDASDDDENYLNFLYIIYEGATLYPNSFSKFFTYIKPKFIENIKKIPNLYEFLKINLSKIKGKKITVAESGLFGTIPLILMCVDNRIDFKLFSTHPALYEVYKNKIFTKNINQLLALEQSISQNQLFIFSSVRNNKTYIKQTTDPNILEKSYQEIANLLNFYKKFN